MSKPKHVTIMGVRYENKGDAARAFGLCVVEVNRRLNNAKWTDWQKGDAVLLPPTSDYLPPSLDDLPPLSDDLPPLAPLEPLDALPELPDLI